MTTNTDIIRNQIDSLPYDPFENYVYEKQASFEPHYLSDDLDEVIQLYKEAGFWDNTWDVTKGLLYGGAKNNQWANYAGYGLMAASMLTPVGLGRGAAMLGARFAPRVAARLAARVANKGLARRALPSVAKWTEGMNAYRKGLGLSPIAASSGIVRKTAPSVTSRVMNGSRNALSAYSGAGVPMGSWTGKQWAGELAKSLVGGSRSNALNWGTAAGAVGISGLTGNWDVAQARLFGPAALRGIGNLTNVGRMQRAYMHGFSPSLVKNVPKQTWKQKFWNSMMERDAYGRRLRSPRKTTMSAGNTPVSAANTAPMSSGAPSQYIMNDRYGLRPGAATMNPRLERSYDFANPSGIGRPVGPLVPTINYF